MGIWSIAVTPMFRVKIKLYSRRGEKGSFTGTNPDHARNAINLCGIRHLGTKVGYFLWINSEAHIASCRNWGIYPNDVASIRRGEIFSNFIFLLDDSFWMDKLRKLQWLHTPMITHYPIGIVYSVIIKLQSRQHLDGPRLQPEILDLKKGRNRKKGESRMGDPLWRSCWLIKQDDVLSYCSTLDLDIK